MSTDIEKFLSAKAFAVVGASKDRNKFGNKVLRCYLQHHKKVYPINPNEEELEGLKCISKIADLPNEVESLSIITPPPITEKIMAQAIQKGIKHIWMQPGAESLSSIAQCKENNITIIAGGPCLLVTLGFKPE